MRQYGIELHSALSQLRSHRMGKGDSTLHFRLLLQRELRGRKRDSVGNRILSCVREWITRALSAAEVKLRLDPQARARGCGRGGTVRTRHQR
jgi:hypothetical protein